MAAHIVAYLPGMKKLQNSELSADVVDWPVHMQRALDLARHVLTATPNPRVGCLLLRDNEVVGEGWHQGPGLAHAEIAALENAGESARGATAFVSLEPCAHHGRTGPCCEALVEAGVTQVVLPLLDPNPEVAGKGVAHLEAHGIEVFHLADFEIMARAINPGFIRRMESSRPFVRMKLAMSLDGRTALANGESKWITGITARSDVQLLRVASSAIVTGVGTVLADDPKLNVRVEDLSISETQRITNAVNLAEQPLRVVLDSKKKTPGTANIFLAKGKTVVYTLSEDKSISDLEAESVEVVKAAGVSGRVELKSVLDSLASDFECNEILIEAGPTLSGAFLEEKLVDELILYIAPKILGADAKPLFSNAAGKSLESLADAHQFDISELVEIGEDIKVTLTPRKVS